MIEQPRRVEKPWGYEIIWADTEVYVGKILHVNAGGTLSMQYHEEKDETMYVLSGEVRFLAGPSPEELQEYRMGPGDCFRTRPGTVHRLIAVTDTDVLEASTPHLHDVVRLQDQYGRTPQESE